MKTEKYCFILAVVIAILCVPALGEQLSQHHEPVLIGRANPTLDGIDKLYVGIAIDKLYFGVAPDIDPNKDGLVWKELETKVINRLREAGVKVVGNTKTVITVGLSILDLSELRIDIDMLKLVDSQQYVFRIQTSISRAVRLPRKSHFSFKADVWKVRLVMQATTVKNMPAAITNAVLNQVETFISCYQIANPKPVQPADATSIAIAPKRPATQIIKPTAAKYKYVASKKRKVFHRPECNSAKRIKLENLIGYNSRIEAIKARKRPCKRCKP